MPDDDTSEKGSIRSILVEMDGLDAALRCIEAGEDPELARSYVEAAVVKKQVSVNTLEEEVVLAAMLRIVDKPIRLPLCAARTKPWDRHVVDTLGLAWTAWAAGQTESAQRELDTLHERMPKGGDKSGAVHLMALHFWQEAIEHLLKRDSKTAYKFFRRALDLGSQFGTESHPLISWTYAATFFHDSGRLRPPLAKCGVPTRERLKVTSGG